MSSHFTLSYIKLKLHVATCTCMSVIMPMLLTPSKLMYTPRHCTEGAFHLSGCQLAERGRMRTRMFSLSSGFCSIKINLGCAHLLFLLLRPFVKMASVWVPLCKIGGNVWVCYVPSSSCLFLS